VELELVIQSKETGDTQTKRLTIEGRLTLGRGPESPIPLEGHGLSREHLAFEAKDGRLEVVDLSSNGTWLNGRRLSPGKPSPATPADRIEIPGYAIRYSTPKPAPAAQTPPAPHSPRRALPRLTKLELCTLVLALAALAITLIFWRL